MPGTIILVIVWAADNVAADNVAADNVAAV